MWEVVEGAAAEQVLDRILLGKLGARTVHITEGTSQLSLPGSLGSKPVVVAHQTWLLFSL